MGRGTWYYSLGVSSIVDAFVRVDGRSHLLSGETAGSDANRIIRDSKKEVWNDCKSCKVRVGSNGNLLWEASVLLGRKKGGEFGMCIDYLKKSEIENSDTEGREDVHEVFQQRGSGVKRKLSRCGRNQLGNEPILALPEGADDFAVYYDARSKDLEACLEKGRSEFDFEAKYHLGKANVDVVPRRLLLQPELPEYKWERITKDVIARIPRLSNEYDANWV
ncbi:hypothetical protein Tco_0564172 [Tanacetum coccineum]